MTAVTARFIITLRRNIPMTGDLLLAELELAALCGAPIRPLTAAEVDAAYGA